MVFGRSQIWLRILYYIQTRITTEIVYINYLNRFYIHLLYLNTQCKVDELMHSNVVYGPYGQVPKLDMFIMMLYIYNLRLNVLLYM